MKKILKTIIIVVFFFTFDSIYSQSLFKIFEKGKVGFIDSTGKVIIEPKFNGACDFSEGLAAARIGSKYGYINEKGDFVITPQFDWAWGFSEGFAVVHNNGKFFYIDTLGKIPFETNFDFLDNFYNGRAFIRTFGNKCGIIDKKGKFIIDTIYNFVSTFQGGNAIVGKINIEPPENNQGIIDSLGILIVPISKYRWIDDFPYKRTNELIQVEIEYREGRNSKCGFINRKGELVFEYDTNYTLNPQKYFNEELIPVQITKLWTVNCNYKSYKDSYLGYMDTLGKIVFCDTNLYDGSLIYNGIALARNYDGKYFIIKRYSDWRIIELNVEPLEDTFKRGEILAKETYKVPGQYGLTDSNVYGILDSNGNFTKFKNNFHSIIFDINNANITNLLESERFLYCMKIPYNKYKNSIDYIYKYGLCNLRGEILSKPIIDKTWFFGFKNGLMKVNINDSRAYMNLDGKVVWKELQFDKNNPDTLDINFLLNGDLKLKGNKTFKIGPEIKSKTFYRNNDVYIFAKTEEKALFKDRYAGFKVYFINSTDNKVQLYESDLKTKILIQVLDQNGKWNDIEYQDIHDIYLITDSIGKYDEKQYTEYTFPFFKGDIKTKFRIKIEQVLSDMNDTRKRLIFYSNEFEGSYNSGQLWKKQQEYYLWHQKLNYPELDYDEDWIFLHHN